MESKIKFDERSFDKMEKEILSKVMNTSKSIIETFKFRMMLGLNTKPSKIKNTLKGLSDFRKKNWDNKLSKNKAYKKYLKLY